MEGGAMPVTTVAVTTSAELLHDPSTAPYNWRTCNVMVDGERSPGGVVYVGDSTVTAGQTDSTKGRRLADGDSLDLGNLQPGERWYAISRSGTVYVSVLTAEGAD